MDERTTLVEYLRYYLLDLEDEVRRPRRGAAGSPIGPAVARCRSSVSFQLPHGRSGTALVSGVGHGWRGRACWVQCGGLRRGTGLELHPIPTWSPKRGKPGVMSRWHTLGSVCRRGQGPWLISGHTGTCGPRSPLRSVLVQHDRGIRATAAMQICSASVSTAAPVSSNFAGIPVNRVTPDRRFSPSTCGEAKHALAPPTVSAPSSQQLSSSATPGDSFYGMASTGEPGLLKSSEPAATTNCPVVAVILP